MCKFFRLSENGINFLLFCDDGCKLFIKRILFMISDILLIENKSRNVDYNCLDIVLNGDLDEELNILVLRGCFFLGICI